MPPASILCSDGDGDGDGELCCSGDGDGDGDGDGELRDALHAFLQGLQESAAPCFLRVLSALSGHGRAPASAFLRRREARRMHARAALHGLHHDPALCSALLHMYGRLGLAGYALAAVFGSMQAAAAARRNVVTWNAMISALVRSRDDDAGDDADDDGGDDDGRDSAFRLFDQMLCEGVLPVRITFLAMANAAKDLAQGARMHAAIAARAEISLDPRVQTCLVSMYGRSGRLDMARGAFDRIVSPGIVSWTCMMSACAESRQAAEAFELLARMQHEMNLVPNDVTLVSLIGLCADEGLLNDGMHLHALAVAFGFDRLIVVTNALLSFYSKCGAPRDAFKLFLAMPKRDRISWNTIISMKDACDEGKGIIEGPWGLFENMCRSGARPSKATFVGLLDACVDAGNRAQAHKAHFCIVESGFDRDPALGNAITNAYGRCRSLGDARGMFDQASKRDSVTWNVMLAALVRNGHGGDAALLYRQMISEGVMPNGPTFLAMFAAVAGLEGLLPIGRGLHSAAMLDSRVSSDIAIRNSIVNMYGRCGDPIAARDAFANMAEHDVVSWNTLLSACAQHHSDAAHLFQEMLSEGILPDEMSFVSMLNACAREECLTEGRRIHARIFRGGQSLHLWNALIDMYHKCNDLETARRIFDEVDRPDCVTWNSIMSALIEEKDCFVLFNDMVQNAVMPDSLTFLTLISACADQAMLGIGKQMHTRILPAELTSISSDAATYTTLVKMYGCCGELVRASRAFEEMLDPNVVSFNSMLSIHAQYGNGEEALALFRNMLEEQVTPDEVTFTCLLSALSHDGRIEAALKLFWRLGRGSERCEDHVNCVIDALGRAGQLEEAERALNASSFLHELLPAMTLLAACKLHKDIDRGNRVIRANLCCHRIGVIAYAKLVNNFDAVGEIVRTINSFIVRDMI